MRRYLGFPVLAAGLIFGLYTHGSWLFFTPDTADTQVLATAAEAEPPEAVAAPALLSVAKRAAESGALTARDADAPREGRMVVSAAEHAPIEPWSTEVVPNARRAKLTSATPADESARYQLIRDIQRELKRVGCYGGAIDGSWGAGSKWALAAFMDRVNASLPMTEPDYILLSLVKSQPANTCGGACPTGQSRTGDGRCQPTAIIAQAERKALSGQTQATVTHVGAMEDGSEMPTAWTTQPLPDERMAFSTAAPLPGRMSVGGPMTEGGPSVVTSQTSFDGAEPPAYQRADASDRAKVKRQKRRAYGTRAVHNIFTHPLGRM